MSLNQRNIDKEIRTLSFLLGVLLFIFVVSFGVFLYLNYQASKTLKETKQEVTSGEVTEKEEKSEAEKEVKDEESASSSEKSPVTKETPQVTLPAETEEATVQTEGDIKGYTRIKVNENIYEISDDKTKILKNSTPIVSLDDGSTLIVIGVPQSEDTIFAILQDGADPKTTYFVQYIKSSSEFIPKRIYRFESVYRMVNFLVPSEQVDAVKTPKDFYLFLVYEYTNGFRLQVRHLVDYTPEYEIKSIVGDFEGIEDIKRNNDGTIEVTVKTSDGIKTEVFFKETAD